MDYSKIKSMSIKYKIKTIKNIKKNYKKKLKKLKSNPIKKYSKILFSNKNIINHPLLLNNLSIELKNNYLVILSLLQKVANLN
jgi:hypothetical protein